MRENREQRGRAGSNEEEQGAMRLPMVDYLLLGEY